MKKAPGWRPRPPARTCWRKSRSPWGRLLSRPDDELVGSSAVLSAGSPPVLSPVHRPAAPMVHVLRILNSLGTRSWSLSIGESSRGTQPPPVRFSADAMEPVLQGTEVLHDMAGFATGENMVDVFVEPVDGEGVSDDGSDQDVVTSQPVVPFIGMEFDTLEDAREVYNKYASKMGFGIRMTSSRKWKKTDEKIRQESECAHARKPEGSKTSSAGDSVNSSASVGRRGEETPAVLTIDLVRRHKVTRHDCKAHLAVGLREGKWRVVVFKDEHTHELVKKIPQRRFYRSHRNILAADYEFLQTLHKRNISTGRAMAMLGDPHGVSKT